MHLLSRTAILLCSFAFIVVVSGCATYQRARFPIASSADEIAGEVVPVSVGDKVRCRLVNGRTLVGRVVGVTEGEIVLSHADSPAGELLTIQTSEFDSLEIVHKSYWRPILGAVIVSAAVTIGLLAQSFGSGLGALN